MGFSGTSDGGKGFPTKWINWVMKTVRGEGSVLMLMVRGVITLGPIEA